MRAVERSIGGDVGEGQGQRALLRTQLALEQEIQRDRAAQLVAVGERIDKDVRPGCAGIEPGDVFDAGISLAVGLELGRRELDRIAQFSDSSR